MPSGRTERRTQVAQGGAETGAGARVKNVGPEPGCNLGARMLAGKGSEPRQQQARRPSRRHLHFLYPGIDLQTAEQANAQHR